MILSVPCVCTSLCKFAPHHGKFASARDKKRSTKTVTTFTLNYLSIRAALTLCEKSIIVLLPLQPLYNMDYTKKLLLDFAFIYTSNQASLFALPSRVSEHNVVTIASVHRLNSALAKH